MVTIGGQAPDFEAEAFQNEKTVKIKLSKLRGKWVVLFFYPADFTFVCPTELKELAAQYDALKKAGVEVLSVSRDTVFVHKAWHDHSDAIKTINFPMVADPTGNICRAYGTLIEAEGLSWRSTFLIDPEGVIKTIEMHDNSIGRSVDELIRKIQAAQFTRKYGDKVCPASWRPGADVLKPGLDLVGKI